MFYKRIYIRQKAFQSSWSGSEELTEAQTSYYIRVKWSDMSTSRVPVVVVADLER